MFATVHNMHLPQFMSLVPEPRAQAIDALSQDWQGRSMYNVHVSTISPAQQSDSEAQDHPGGRGDTHSPLVAVTTVVLTFTMSVCGPPMPLSVPPRPGHNRAISRAASRTICKHGGSHAATKQQDFFRDRSLSL